MSNVIHAEDRFRKPKERTFPYPYYAHELMAENMKSHAEAQAQHAEMMIELLKQQHEGWMPLDFPTA